MTAQTTLRPEVVAFVAQVRLRLADLSEDEREELTGGLEADLSEQHAAGDPLPDPTAYAAELRAAAGLPARARGRHRHAPERAARPARVRGSSAASRACPAWSLVVTLRPAWWVLRAWIAVTLLDQLVGGWEYVTLWPTLYVPGLGLLVLLAAVVVSVLIGQGRLWPGSGPDRPAYARVLLLALNAFAVVVPLTFHVDGDQVESYSYAPVSVRPDDGVLRHGRDVVRNVYPYDANGQPLTGVQLFDQAGRPIEVAPQSSLGANRRERQVTCPSFNGTTPLFNVFPLQQRTQPSGTCLQDHPDAGVQAYAEPPLASVPPASVAAR